MENIEIELQMILLMPQQFVQLKAMCAYYFKWYCAIDQGHIVSTDDHRAFACDLQVVSERTTTNDFCQLKILKAFLKKIPAKNS